MVSESRFGGCAACRCRDQPRLGRRRSRQRDHASTPAWLPTARRRSKSAC